MYVNLGCIGYIDSYLCAQGEHEKPCPDVWLGMHRKDAAQTSGKGSKKDDQKEKTLGGQRGTI